MKAAKFFYYFISNTPKIFYYFISNTPKIFYYFISNRVQSTSTKTITMLKKDLAIYIKIRYNLPKSKKE